MEAKDTVMIRPRLQEIWTKAIDVKVLAVAPDAAAVSCILAVAKTQAEISFRAGIFKAGEGVWDKVMGAKKSGYEEGLIMGRKKAVELIARDTNNFELPISLGCIAKLKELNRSS